MEERAIQVFEDEFFKTRGYIDNEGTAQFNVEDVARGLGITQTKNGVEYVRWETFNRYVSEIKANSSSQVVGKIPVPLGKDDFIPENLVYRLAMKVNNETAEKFQSWIADVVVPEIRKKGVYISPNAKVTPPDEIEIDPNKLPPHLTDDIKNCVYALAFANGTVKIGRSSRFFERANEVKNIVHLDVVNSYHTGYLPISMARNIERACHRSFNFCRVQSEIFNANFAEVCAAVAEHARKIIEMERHFYGEKWSESHKVYNKFLAEIPLPPGAQPIYIFVEKNVPIPEPLAVDKPADTKTIDVPAKIAAADATKKLPLKNKIEYLLECARIATLEGRKEYFLQRVDALI